MQKMKSRFAAAALALALSASLAQPALAWDTKAVTRTNLADENLAPGIHYTEEDILGYGEDSRRVRINHLAIDPEADGVEFRSARAEDTINARENILNQALRDVYQGVNVVASINADPYDMDYGINCGIQVREGAVVISQPNNSYTTNTPAFFVDGDGTPHIDSLRAVADITVDGADYSRMITTINRNMFATWYGNDQSKMTTDTLRIYTSNITSDNTMTHYRTANMPENQGYALIQLEDFDGAIQAGEDYTGTVKEVYTEDGFDIPNDCIVLAGYAGDAEGVAALQAGQEVRFACHLYTGDYTEDGNDFLEDRGEQCDDVTTAVNGYHLLVKDGNVNQVMVDNSGTDVNSRTVIGITDEGKVEILCINKPGANFSSELTSGSTFKEVAEYMVNELGCVDVLNMDGGGSTEMTARRAGSDELDTVSHPSDGGSRIVSNSLLIVSNARRTADVGQVLVDGNAKLYLNTQTEFSVRLTDASGSVLSSGGRDITWSAARGTIDENGCYTAPATPGEDTVTATVDGKSGTATVTVVDESGINTIGFSATGTVALAQGDTYQFGFNAYDKAKQTIQINPALAQWSLEGDDIGTLNDSGLLNVTAETGEATITATFLGQTYSVRVVVGLKEQIIDDFEGNQAAYHISSRYIYPNHPDYYAGDGENMVGITNDLSQVKNGNGSLYWIYDTKDWPRTTNGTLYFYPDWDCAAEGRGWTAQDQAKLMDQYRAKAQPKKFGLWIYSGDENNDGISDNYNCMMTAQFIANDGTYVDENGETQYVGADGGKQLGKSIKITPDEHMNWIGWKYFEFDVPEDWPMPITFNYLWMSNIYKGADQANYETTVMLDDLKWIYTDEEQDLTGPVFSETTPSGSGLFSNRLDFSTVISDESGVKAETITVTVNDEPVTDYTYDAQTGKLSFTKTDLADGQTYRVVVKAKDNKGNDSTSFVNKTYNVDLSDDTAGPVVSNVTPVSSSKLPVQIPSPRIGFKISDLKSGVDAASIEVTLNGQSISDVYCDEATGWCYAQPGFLLPSGTTSAEITIDAADKAGNAMETYRDTVAVALIAQPENPENYSISVIPDTQGNTYSSMIFPKAENSDSELVIHLGDIVDGVNTSEFDEGKTWADSMNKPYLVAAGNHEGGNLDLDLYNQYFGSPTYYFDYGSTRIIMLNSAFTQSISASDPTQYRFLERALESNTLPNVYVISHVVPEDHFNTQHNMTAEECAQFEDILGAYKTAHPQVNVTEISGHLHTLESYDRQGVTYIIGGNAAGKGYVTAEQGNLLGIGTIQVKNGVASYCFDPLLTKVYIRNAAMDDGVLRLAKGGSAQLDVYGDFREKASVNSYMTQINDDSLVRILWSTSDPAVATVDENGVVTMVGEGSARITAASGGKSSTITLESVDMSNVEVAKLAVNLPDSILVGDTVRPTVTATDTYGATFALNNADVTFTSANAALSVQPDGTLTAVKAGADVLTAQYRGLTATASFTVKERPVSGGSSSSNSSYPVSVSGGSSIQNGSITVSPRNAEKGDTVTITTKPDSGYKLDKLTVTDHKGNELTLTDKGDGKYTFIMPDGRVDVKASFAKIAATSFADVPADYWAADEIAWAYKHGYMNGTSATTFNASGTVTRQQLWMVLARINGQSPADMSAAKAWAVENGISDGTNPGNAISRQQLVAILYRYAVMMGYDTTGRANLTTFPDSGTMAAYATDAMAWSVAEGIVGGTTQGMLNPAGTATRAQFAVILMRFTTEASK